MSQNELAGICEVEPITVGRLVDRLEARGFVERRPDPTDRRVNRLHLLAAAQPILEEISSYRDVLLDDITEGLDESARAALVDALLHIKNRLTAEEFNLSRLKAAGE
jgi:MarR family transcriptional regulator, transcriptional regulator for hemolysin